MKPQLISPVMAAFFALLAAIFLLLSAIHGSPASHNAWRRIGIIFALAALVIFIVSPR